MLGAPEYKYAWCAKKEEYIPVNDDGLLEYLEDEYEFEDQLNDCEN